MLPEFVASTRAMQDFVTSWETGTLHRARWTHAAHVCVATYYVYQLPPDEALRAMRAGILRFNASVGIENTNDSGYHETLTRFWLQTIAAFVTAGNFPNVLDAVRAAVEEYGDARELHRSYYRHDIVADMVARREWVPPSKDA